jgi:hypothetical protein
MPWLPYRRYLCFLSAKAQTVKPIARDRGDVGKGFALLVIPRLPLGLTREIDAVTPNNRAINPLDAEAALPPGIARDSR